jgi:hypothetical protein
MPTAAAKPIDHAAAPACHRCGAATRLFGLEAHSTVERAELRTYVCLRCDGVQAEVVPLWR